MNQRHEKSRATNNERQEISEEYDIQTIVSGLTRNSEFLDYRDPPPPATPEYNHSLDRSTDWPDDETSGEVGHHVIHVMDGDQVMSKDKIKCRKDDFKVPVSEPNGAKEQLPTEETLVLTLYETPKAKSNPGYGITMSSEPEGIKFRNGKKRSTTGIEPSGTKMESIMYGCLMKNDNPRDDSESRMRPATVVMNEQNVEVVYQESNKRGISKKKEGKNSRQRSKSSNAVRSTRNKSISSSRMHDKRSNEMSRETSRRSNEGKRRSRSLPRTLRRITSRYLKSEASESQRDPPSRIEAVSYPFGDGIVGFETNEIVSELGSQCDGIESQVSKRREFEKSSSQHSRRSFSSRSEMAFTSPHTSQKLFVDSETRVCVGLSERPSGGRYQTTSRVTGFIGRRKSGYNDRPSQDMDTTQELTEKFLKKNIKNKIQIDAFAEEASRNSLLSPNDKDDSYVEQEDPFRHYNPTPSSYLERKHGKTRFDTRANLKSAPVTPSPEKELRQEYAGHKSRAYIDNPDVTHLSMTPAGRKELIQRYLELREKHEKSEASIISSDHQSQSSNVSRFSRRQSVAYEEDANSIVEDTSSRKNVKIGRKKGYDDASKHYQDSMPDQWTRQNHVRHIASRNTSLSKQSRRVQISERNDATGSNMSVQSKENFYSMPNSYKNQMSKKECWNSPTLVSSFPCSQQEKLSYSYVSDDSSSTPLFDLKAPYAFPRPSNYVEELRPHNQFMKMQMGLGNR